MRRFLTTWVFRMDVGYAIFGEGSRDGEDRWKEHGDLDERVPQSATQTALRTDGAERVRPGSGTGH